MKLIYRHFNAYKGKTFTYLFFLNCLVVNLKACLVEYLLYWSGLFYIINEMQS